MESGGCMINDIGRCMSVVGFSLDLVAAVPVDDKAGGSSNKDSISIVSEKTEPLTGRRTSQPTFELQLSADNTTYCNDDDVLFNKDQLAMLALVTGLRAVYLSKCVKCRIGRMPFGAREVNPVAVEDSNDSNLRDYKGLLNVLVRGDPDLSYTGSHVGPNYNSPQSQQK
ncbi:unnamed protein product [Peronospora destructor]|uniref:Uncharacterized protein n=1 Tax=Peronospora destructor TaxID=86335 RepID=A0AAV0UDT3_9STRA|nr:unnamed protein product [Peronospora destructor]